MKKILRVCLWLVGILVTLALVVLIAFQVSPRPGAYLIGKMFNDEVKITDETAYQKSLPHVTVKNDLTYTSDYDRSTFDLYLSPRCFESTSCFLGAWWWLRRW